MGQFELSAEHSFSASHQLPGVPLCERFHGHDWNVRLTVSVEEGSLSKTGMGIDFRDLETAIERAVSDWDHRYLNEVPPFDSVAPSAENIARVVCERTSRSLATHNGLDVLQVEVWETNRFKVVYRPG